MHFNAKDERWFFDKNPFTEGYYKVNTEFSNIDIAYWNGNIWYNQNSEDSTEIKVKSWKYMD